MFIIIYNLVNANEEPIYEKYVISGRTIAEKNSKGLDIHKGMAQPLPVLKTMESRCFFIRNFKL